MNLIRQLYDKGHNDLAQFVIGLTSHEQPDEGLHDTPHSSEPKLEEGTSPLAEPIKLQLPEDPETLKPKPPKAAKKLFNVDMECQLWFQMESTEDTEEKALEIAPGKALDLLDEIKDELNKKYKGFNISFDKVRPVKVTEVPIEED